MTTVHTVEVEVGGRTITLETGKLAKQANGAVLLRCEDTVVLVTAVAREEMRENQDFFPLTVDVEERMYAAGKIPGGFIKRESRPSDKATLTARQIDRPIRPSFPQGFMNEVQIIGTVLSYDQENAYDVLTMTGASAALTISEIPFLGPLGAVRVGLIDGEYVVNPLLSQLDEATLDLVVSGSRDAIVMVEAGANEATEEQVLEGLRIAHREIQKLIDAQLRLAELAGKPKWEVPAYEVDRGLYDEIVRSYGAEVDRVTAIADKKACHDATASPSRKRRPDGRSTDEIRPITCEVSASCRARTARPSSRAARRR
jgi:polyribonucleotide nucleotidyltransferase